MTEQSETSSLYGSESTFYINNADDLTAFSNLSTTKYDFTDKTVILTADIESNDTTSLVTWTPIGNVSYKFNGTFDGGNHTISGLYFSSSIYDSESGEGTYVGLFGSISSSATVKNLNVANSYIKGSNFVGSITGNNNGKVINCSFGGVIDSDGFAVGGIAGQSQSGNVTNCYNTGAVSNIEDVESVGNIVGYVVENTDFTKYYYLDSLNGSGVGFDWDNNQDTTIAISEADMKSNTFIDKLGLAIYDGTGFTMDRENPLENNGFPVLGTPVYDIEYNLNGGTVNGTNVVTYTYGTSVTLPADVTKTAYTFDGWYETADFTLNNPTRAGYTFIGWTGSNGTTPEKNVTISHGTTGVKEYTANKGYSIADVKVNGESVGAVVAYTFTDIKADAEISVEFKELEEPAIWDDIRNELTDGEEVKQIVINLITGEVKSITLSLSHNGDFGFEAVLTVELGADTNGYYANLMYYNETTGELEAIDSSIITNGKADLLFTHASEWAIYIDDEDYTAKVNELETEQGTDDAGDTNAGHSYIPMIILMVMLVLSGVSFAAVAATGKRRKMER